MKKLFLTFAGLFLIVLPFATQPAPLQPDYIMTAGWNEHQSIQATIENGMTLLLMLSAFYMISKNFMFQKRIDQLKEKVRVVFDLFRIQ